MTVCCRGARRFAMSNLPWRQASLPEGERARRARETLQLVELDGFEEAFPTNFPAA